MNKLNKKEGVNPLLSPRPERLLNLRESTPAVSDPSGVEPHSLKFL